MPEKLKDKVEILSMEPMDVINLLSGQGYSNLYIDGGKVIQNFLQNDLIDDMIITKVPLLIGNGIPLFGFLKHDLAFKHIKTAVLSNRLVKSYYKRER